MTDETIFATALDKADPAERTAFLTTACADAAQRRRVDGLLAAHDAAGTFLDHPPVVPFDPDTATTRTFRDGPDAAPDPDDLSFLAPPRRPDSLGRIGHYEVLEVLGRGGFGIVFRAFDDVLQRVVAVKVLAPQMAATSPARKRFLREARSAAPIQHENVVRVHAVEESPLPYLVMEFIRGETLQQSLDRTGPLDAAEVVRVGRQLAEGLDAAHAQGLIHRDIKPANVLIEGGPQKRVKLTDFGLARAADDASLSQSGVVAGTPMYMAPEQAKGDALDARADLFSLGSVLYVMCTGRPPFRASGTLAVLKRVCDEHPRPIREVIPEVPEWLCRVVERLHAKHPADRYQTAREVADVLADCERQLQTGAAAKGRAPEPAPARRASGRRWAALAALAVALAALGVYALTRPKPHRQGDDGWKALASGQEAGDWGTVVDPAGGCTVQTAGSRLRITVPPGTHDLSGWYKVYSAPRVVREVRGDFRARVRVLPFADPGTRPGGPAGPYLTGSLVVWGDGEHFARLDRVSHHDGEPGGRTRRHAVVAFHTSGQPIAPDPPDLRRIEEAQPSHLELERRGAAVTARTSLDGVNWSAPFRLPPLDLPEAVRVGVAAVAVNAAEAHAVQFDGFEVTPLGPPTAGEDGWVQLFNGADLSGLKAEGAWKVEGGALVSHAPNSRVDPPRWFADFHLRAQLKVGPEASAALLVRNRDGQAAGVVLGKPFPTFDPALTTGSVYRNVRTADGFRQHVVAPWTGRLVEPNAWFDAEVVARGSEVVVRVNGTETARHTFADFLPDGKISVYGVWDKVHVRRLEIKELPPTKAAPPTVDLLALIDPKRDALQGTWARDGAALVSPPPLAQLQVPFAPPENYRLTMEVERTGSPGALNFGLIVGGRTACVALDYDGGDGPQSGISGLDGKVLRNSAAVYDGPALAAGRNVVVAEVTGRRVVVRAGATKLIDWEGDPARLAVLTLWEKTDGKRLYVGHMNRGFRFHRLELEPLAPAPAPPLAVAPFDAPAARAHQEAWARHLGVPVEVTGAAGLKLRLIPPGEFTMGSGAAEVEWLLRSAEFKDAPAWTRDGVRAEGPDRRVAVREPFLFGVHEVTVGQFRAFVAATNYKTAAEANGGGFVWAGEGWEQKPEYAWNNPKLSGGEGHPVVFVAPADARAFCAWLGEKDGRRYAVPTEEQWEYACRAGTAARWFFGDDAGRAKEFGWTNPDSQGGNQPVGRLAANPFGLYDVCGNALELALGPQEAAFLRGGEAGLSVWQARSASRLAVDKPGESNFRQGFRVAVVGDLTAKPAPNPPAPNPPAPAPAPRPVSVPAALALPLTEKAAAVHQAAWAKHLGTEVEFAGAGGIAFRVIPPGAFDMGLTAKQLADEEAVVAAKKGPSAREFLKQLKESAPPRRVALTRPFALGRTEVTVGQYRAFVAATGHRTACEADGKGGFGRAATGEWKQAPEFNWANTGAADATDDLPATNLSYDDADAFCRWLTRTSGRPHRLPTEAEWEWACRAGTAEPWHWGAATNVSRFARHGNHKNDLDHLAVGQLVPNAFGLRDMSGNAAEWCADAYAAYPPGPATDPTGPAAGTVRVVRGGSVRDVPWASSSVYREPGKLAGFRVAVDLERR